jgi:threonine dehydrogenase-like Zn-dependent dehydrogenase
MIAAVLTRPKTFELQDVRLPEINESDLKIKVEGCGVCASSIPLWEGREWFRYPYEPGSPGHEGWGIVEETGAEVSGIKQGDRVAFLSYHAYAEYDKTDFRSAVVVPDSLRQLPFPGEPLGCALNIFERCHISPGDTVAIIGSGFLGALLCQLCKSEGAKVIAISRRRYSLQKAVESGADEAIELTATWEVANKVAEITKKLFCTKVIEATGKQEGIDIATEIVAEGGRLIIAGYHQDGLRHVDVQKWNWKGIDVVNAHERDPRRYVTGMQKAIDAIKTGKIDPAQLYTDTVPLDRVSDAFEMTTNRPDGFMKALIVMK